MKSENFAEIDSLAAECSSSSSVLIDDVEDLNFRNVEQESPRSSSSGGSPTNDLFKFQKLQKFNDQGGGAEIFDDLEAFCPKIFCSHHRQEECKRVLQK